jgi:hypothetical protein
MRPLLLYCLPALGICRNFPRALVFGPMEYSGLGFKHLFTDQEIARLQDFGNPHFDVNHDRKSVPPFP